MPHVAMLHEADPRDTLMQAVGNLDDIDIFHRQVLVAIYMRPKQTAGGIHLPDKHVEEDLYQGKVGLILKCGKAAFVADKGWDFDDLRVGDWVIFKPSDGFPTSIMNGKEKVPCRILQDDDIKLRISHPDQVW